MKNREGTNRSPHNQLMCCFRIHAKSLYAFCLIVFLACAFLLLPIRFTPWHFAFSHGTWQTVNTFNLVKIMSRRFPSGVKPHGPCSKVSEVNVSASLLSSLSIVNYNTSKFRQAIKNGKYDSLKAFFPLLKPATKRTLMLTYLVLHQSLESANVPHVLVDGALLGMYRFSSLTPWDDDLDIYIPLQYWRRVRDLLSCVKGYELMVDPNMRWSFFPSSAPQSVAMTTKKYPFIDLFFYAEEGQYVMPINPLCLKHGLFLKSQFYPVTWGLFEGMKVPIPHKLKDILVSEFGDLSECVTQSYGHMYFFHGSHSVNCSALFPLYGTFPLM